MALSCMRYIATLLSKHLKNSTLFLTPLQSVVTLMHTYSL